MAIENEAINYLNIEGYRIKHRHDIDVIVIDNNLEVKSMFRHPLDR